MAYVAGLHRPAMGQSVGPTRAPGAASVWAALVIAGVAVGLFWATLRIRPGAPEKLR
jgi:hypothetical protein